MESRILYRLGEAPAPKWGRQPIILANFSKELNKYEKSWIEWGASLVAFYNLEPDCRNLYVPRSPRSASVVIQYSCLSLSKTGSGAVNIWPPDTWCSKLGPSFGKSWTSLWPSHFLPVTESATDQVARRPYYKCKGYTLETETCRQ